MINDVENKVGMTSQKYVDLCLGEILVHVVLNSTKKPALKMAIGSEMYKFILIQMKSKITKITLAYNGYKF